MTQSTISNDVGVAVAKRYFHKGSVSQLTYGSFLEQLLGFKNSQSLCMGPWGAFTDPWGAS